MKTLTELMDNVKKLQKGLKDVYGDIAALQEAERSQENIPDIIDWLNYAKEHPLEGHPLTTVNNIEVSSTYVRLLFSVAMCHIYLNHETSPLVYPCQLVAVLGKNINGERLFKESLTLDDLTLRKCCEQIKAHKVEAYFLIDALIITGKYEQDNHDKMDYIASLAAIMEVTPEKFADILTLAKVYVEEPKEFVGRLIEVYTPESQYYLQSCTSLKVIDTPVSFTAISEKQRICDKAICQFLPLSAKKSAVFSNIAFQNLQQNQLAFSNMQRLEFSDCEFKNFDHTVITAASIEEIIMKRVKFSDCIYENRIGSKSDDERMLYCWSDDEYYVKESSDLSELVKKLSERFYLPSLDGVREQCVLPHGILGDIHQVGKIVLHDVVGRNCYARCIITYKIWSGDRYGIRSVPDYTENCLFKGIDENKIEKYFCTWEECCKLI